MATTPAIVIVPGSFVPAKLYNGIASKLQSAGFDTVEVVELASVGREGKAHPTTMTDDAAQITTVVEKIADSGKDVLLVPHSYGGIPSSEAIKGLTKEERTAVGKKGGITGLLFVTAVVPAVGESLESTLPGATEGLITVEDGWMSIDPEVASQYTFNDLSIEEGLNWQKQFLHHALPSYQERLTYPGYKYVPVTYMFTERDMILPQEVQKKMIGNIETAGAKVNVIQYDTGHVPHMSNPDAVVDAVKKAVGQ